MKVLFEQAKVYFESIQPEDRIFVITHHDGDGISAGILFKEFCKLKECKNFEIDFFKIGKSSLFDFQDKIKKSDKIFIFDIAQNLILDSLDAVKGKNVFYTDHHTPIEEFNPGESFLEYITHSGICSCHAVYDLVKDKVKNKDLIFFIGLISDAGDRYPENKELIKEMLSKFEISLENFKKEYVIPSGFFEIYFRKNLNKFFEISEKINSPEDINLIEDYIQEVKLESEQLIKDFNKKYEQIGDIYFYYFEPKFELKSAVTNAISYKNPDKIFIFASFNLEENPGRINLSARNQSKKVDCVELLKKGIAGLEGSNCGGHMAAAGGYIQRQDLEKFKENLLKA